MFIFNQINDYTYEKKTNKKRNEKHNGSRTF